MKKKLMLVTLALAGILTVVGCGKTEADTSSTDNTATTTESGSADASTTATSSGINVLDGIEDVPFDEYLVKLGDYKSITIESVPTTVTDADVDETINSAIKSATTNVVVEDPDRTVKTGDIACINYEGKMNGEAFEGGTDKSEAGYDLEIGSGSFIPGFEDALVGMKTGETKDIDLVFPDEYYEELAGKPVTFTVTIKSIKEKNTPELNDEYAASQGLEGVSTVAELKAYVKKMLEQNASLAYDKAVMSEIMNKLISTSEFKDGIPKEKFEYYYNNTYANDEAQATDYGLQLEGYVMYVYGVQSLDEYVAQITEYAKKSVKLDAVIETILEEEKQQVTEADIDEYINENYENFGYASADEFKSNFVTEEFESYLKNLKVIDIIKKYAGVIE